MLKPLLILLLTLAMLTVSFLPVANALGIIFLLVVSYLYRKKSPAVWQKTLLWLLMVPLVFWIASWRPEGFSYPLLMEYVSQDGENSFSLYANLAKGLAGFCLLVFLWPTQEQRKYACGLPWQILVVLFSPLVVIASAVLLFDLQWQPKLLEQIFIFGSANLVLTCVAEEAFMRLLLQQPMIQVMQGLTKNRWIQELVPLILVTAVFVAVHSGVSGVAIAVYTLAGFLYGLAYSVSKNILYPIGVHATVNIIHFSFLTYPL